MSKDELQISVVKGVTEVLASGINTEEMKDKVKEYIEVCKLKIKIAKEIAKLSKEQNQTNDFLVELKKDLVSIENELKDQENV